ncbi:glycosyltransferase family 8 protein [Paracoccus sp. (in: a-proteobacteria)]|uniref:glycosyltransferase family 8 protein n=1 Tax=Paracoccus sp. TaxID=267 RepID=UPI00272B63E0|nr:glycosyltransferase family 8 protein [Paracoccus sp. (in: a-proteobacteria)]
MLIVTGSDNNYVPGVLVLVASAALHNPSARFAVLDMGINPENRARIDALAHRLGVSLRRVEVSEDHFDHLLIKRDHLTRSTYLRLLIPDLFPDEDRAIYMDCDMVVMGDLSELDQVELGDALIAAVPCPSPDPLEVEATGHMLGTYVNAGLLVMNLPLWRQERVAETCMRLLSDPDRPLLSEDQSAINIIARGRMRLLDPRLNVYSDPGSYPQSADFPQAPLVLHYVVNNKPWALPTPLGRIWQFHADRIADLMPPRCKLSLRRRLSLLNRDRKMLLGLALGRGKYRIRKNTLALMNGPVTEAYLLRAARLAR